MKASLARLTALLACHILAISVPGHSLKCVCNTDGIAFCENGICELKTGIREENKLLYPYCAAIRHPVRGDYLACAYSAQVEIHRECSAQNIPQDNVTVDRCWCNNGDFCNGDLLAPLPEEEEEEDENVKETENQSSPTAISPEISTFHGSAIKPSIETELSTARESAIQTSVEEATVTQAVTSPLWTETPSPVAFMTEKQSSSPLPVVPESTTTPHSQIDLDFDKFQTTTATRAESDEESEESIDSTTSVVFGTDLVFKAHQDGTGVKTLDDDHHDETSRVEIHDTSIETVSLSTPSTTDEKNSGAMTRLIQASSGGSLRTDYLKPAPVNEEGASLSRRCEGGDCNSKRGPSSKNNASTVSSCGNNLFKLFLFILLIPVTAALHSL